MDQDKLRKIKVMLTNMKTSISEIVEKSKHLSKAMATQFNRIRAEVLAAFPELESILPQPITSTHPYSLAGLADETYDGLAVYVEMMIGLVSDSISEK